MFPPSIEVTSKPISSLSVSGQKSLEYATELSPTNSMLQIVASYCGKLASRSKGEDVYNEIKGNQ